MLYEVNSISHMIHVHLSCWIVLLRQLYSSIQWHSSRWLVDTVGQVDKVLTFCGHGGQKVVTGSNGRKPEEHEQPDYRGEVGLILLQTDNHMFYGEVSFHVFQQCNKAIKQNSIFDRLNASNNKNNNTTLAFSVQPAWHHSVSHAEDDVSWTIHLFNESSAFYKCQTTPFLVTKFIIIQLAL